MKSNQGKYWWWGVALLVTVLAFSLGGLKINQAAEERPRARPVVPGVDDKITVRNMHVRLPAGTGWTRREVPIPPGGKLYEFERDLPNGNRLQIHIADYVGPAKIREYETMMKDKTDAQRLARLIDAIESSPDPNVRRTEWVKIVRGPQRRYGAICRERHDLREDQESKGRFLWQDWMLFCVDPFSRISIQVDYAERYPAGGTISPSFSRDAAAFYDSIEFRPVGK